MPSHTVTEPTALFRIMVDSKLSGGSGEAKRLVQEGGVRINGEQVKDPNQQINVENGSELRSRSGLTQVRETCFGLTEGRTQCASTSTAQSEALLLRCLLQNPFLQGKNTRAMA